jgi:branched-chain amino acid transport system permease protein
MPYVIAAVIAVLTTAFLIMRRHLHPVRASLGGLATAVVAVAPHLGFAKETTSFFPISTMVVCAVYVLFALGLNIVVGYAGLLDLGYVAFFIFGAYVGGWYMSTFAVNLNENLTINFWSATADGVPGVHLSFWLVLIIAAVVAAIAGVIIGAPTLRLKSDYLALVTLGFGEILFEVFRNGGDIFGLNLTNGSSGIGPVDSIATGPLSLLPGFGDKITAGPLDLQQKYYVIVAMCLIFIWVSLKLREGRLGRAWMAIREDELAASLMGVPLMKAKLWSYAIGAVAGGIGGAFYSQFVGTVNIDNFQFIVSVIVLCSVILGGMGNVWGVSLGAVVIMWVNYTGLNWTGEKIGVSLTSYQLGLFGLLLVLMMLFRPDGFLPAARAKQVKKAEANVAEVAPIDTAPTSAASA